jgi:hypothetical protein
MIDSHRPPLLLLPDLLCTGDIWARQSDGLAQSAGRAPVGNQPLA